MWRSGARWKFTSLNTLLPGSIADAGKNEVQILIGRRRKRYRTHDVGAHMGGSRNIFLLPCSSQ